MMGTFCGGEGGGGEIIRIRINVGSIIVGVPLFREATKYGNTAVGVHGVYPDTRTGTLHPRP